LILPYIVAQTIIYTLMSMTNAPKVRRQQSNVINTKDRSLPS